MSNDSELLSTLLKDVSRSFYLTLRVLPGRVRRQIGLAYLLARTTDTIADTELVPVDERSRALERFRERVAGKTREALDFSALTPSQGSAAERTLLEKGEAVLNLLGRLAPADRDLVRQVITVIVSGQELDLRRFGGASVDNILALRTDAELDDYTFRVAGCVGEFWTRLCRAHLFQEADLDDAWFLANGVRFGKGLQLVNILRDLPSDLRLGRCYLPADRLGASYLAPQQLLALETERTLRPLYDEYLRRAREHLVAGWAYTNALPWRHFRVRLACAWPILIGVDTLDLLSRVNVLDPNAVRKVAREHVKRLLWRSVLLYPWPSAWKRLIAAPASALKAVASDRILP